MKVNIVQGARENHQDSLLINGLCQLSRMSVVGVSHNQSAPRTRGTFLIIGQVYAYLAFFAHDAV